MTNQNQHLDADTAARTIGGLAYQYVLLMNHLFEEGDTDRAHVLLAALADINEQIDTMSEGELRSLVDGLFAQVVGTARGRYRVLNREAALTGHLGPHTK